MRKKSALPQDIAGRDDQRKSARAKFDTGDTFYRRIEEGPDAGKVYVDLEKAARRYLDELGVKPDQVDRYWLETVRHLLTFDLKVKFEGRLPLVILNRPAVALKNFPPGKGEAAAMTDAPEHYKRLQQRRSAAAI